MWQRTHGLGANAGVPPGLPVGGVAEGTEGGGGGGASRGLPAGPAIGVPSACGSVHPHFVQKSAPGSPGVPQ